MASGSAESRRTPRERFHLREIMLLIAGLAVGLWLVLPAARSEVPGNPGDWLVVVVYLLGGLSLAGPPLLILERRRRQRPWGVGRFFWFVQGTASWLLWPPVAYARARGRDLDDSITAVCYFYGTPLMALYIALALLADGRLRRTRRRRLRRSAYELFGLVLGLIWACTGLYVLSLLYAQDFNGR